MTLGTITLLEAAAAQGPLFHDRVSIVGDDNYPAGGSPGFEALAQAAIGSGRTLVAVLPDHDTEINLLEYDHANDKLFVRVHATGVESAVSDQSGLTYNALCISK